MIESPQAFADSLPKSPFRQHLREVYTIVYFLYAQGDPHRVPAVEMAAHHLREISRGTAAPDWHREAVRDEVLRDLGLPPGTRSAIRNPFETLERSLKKMREGFAGVRTATPRDPEAFGWIRMRNKIEDERRQGLAFVHSEAARVRKELGLNTTPTRSKR